MLTNSGFEFININAYSRHRATNKTLLVAFDLLPEGWKRFQVSSLVWHAHEHRIKNTRRIRSGNLDGLEYSIIFVIPILQSQLRTEQKTLLGLPGKERRELVETNSGL